MLAILVLLVGVAANVLAVNENHYDVVILGGGFSGIGEARECLYKKASWNSCLKVYCKAISMKYLTTFQGKKLKESLEACNFIT